MIRVAIRVRPGASRTAVGGAAGDPPRLVIAVNAPAVDGRATDAALAALAKALGVARRDITVVTGHTSRDKVIDIDADDAAVGAVLQRLRGA